MRPHPRFAPARLATLAVAAVGLLTSFTASLGSAQDDGFRKARSAAWRRDGDEIHIDANAGDQPSRLRWTTGYGSPVAVTTLPFERVGGLTAAGDTFVVSGWSPRTGGKLVRVRLTSGADPQVEACETRDCSFDPWDVAFSREQLYVLDRSGRRILRAAWDGASALPEENQFVHVLNAWELLQLRDPDGMRLAGGDDVWLLRASGAAWRLHAGRHGWLVSPDPARGPLAEFRGQEVVFGPSRANPRCEDGHVPRGRSHVRAR
jgi:hypothetical protein